MHRSYKTILASVLLLATQSTALNYNTTTYVGCYKSNGGMAKADSFTYQSFGHCQEQCIPQSGDNAKAVMGLTNGSDCYCGGEIPSQDDKADESACNKGCTGFGTDNCGGDGAYSIYLTGWDNSVGTAAGIEVGGNGPKGSASDSGSGTSTQSPSVITKAGETIVVTASGQADPNSSGKPGGGSNKVGIAVGVVVGVVLFAAAIGGGIFYMRHRKRKAVEEEYRRNQAINSFVTSDKPISKNGSSISDQRLDPAAMRGRRQSDASMADDQDYSRRILQVRTI